MNEIMKQRSRRAMRALDRLTRNLEPRLASAFLVAVRQMRNRVSIARVERLVRQGDLTGAITLVTEGGDLGQAMRGRGIEPGTRTVEEVLLESFRQGGQMGAEQLPRNAALEASLDLTNPESIAFLSERLPDLIRQVSDEQKNSVRLAVLRGFEEGRPIPEIARDVRGNIGLTESQAAAVRSFRRQLETGRIGEASAPWDRRLSGPEKQQARSLFRSTSPDPRKVDAIVNRYRESLVNRRALNIARTEVHRAAIAGQQELWRQAAERGLIEGTRTRRVWIVTPDERLRQCLPPKTQVLTIDGWRAISSIRVGDWVLTKEDRYKRVTQTFSKGYNGAVARLEFGGRCRVKVTATFGHPVMTRNGWTDIEKIGLDTDVQVLAVPCASCGELIPRGPGRAQWCSACGNKKAVKAAASPEARAKAIKSRQQGAGWRKGYKGTKHLDSSKSKMSASAKERMKAFPGFRDTKVQHKAQLSCALKNPNENKIAKFLDSQGIEYERQWMFEHKGKVQFADFYLPGPNLVVECDGWHHTAFDVEEKDRQRDELLKSQGIKVVRVTTSEIQKNFPSVASAIRQHCCFIWLKPKKVAHYLIARQSVHDIAVEDDVSFVAGGVVVHNSHAAVPGMNPNGVGINEPFQTPAGLVMRPGEGPPSFSINCRCAEGLRFDSD